MQTSSLANLQLTAILAYLVHNEREPYSQRGPVAGQCNSHPVLIERDPHLLKESVHVESKDGEASPFEANIEDEVKKEEGFVELWT